MNVLASIKAPRRMSFKHWRYRALHWCFGIKPDSPATSPLPDFLYTHYCPLFHLTNLIALLAPFILVLKLVLALGKALVISAVYIWGKLPTIDLFEVWEDRRQQQRAALKDDVAYQKNKERKEVLELIKHNYLDHRYDVGEFDRFWHHWDHHFIHLSKEEVEEAFNGLIDRIAAARERVEERKAKIRQRIIFWVNFSQTLLKWVFNAAYFVLFGLVAYLCYLFFVPAALGVWDFLCFVFSFNPIPLFLFIGKWLLILFGVALLVYGFIRSNVLRHCGKTVATGCVGVLPPFRLVGGLFVALFKWISSGFCGILDFVEVFYEENCPPITIVSPDDESIDALVEE